MGLQNGAASVENRMEVPQKIKNRILLLGIYPKELKSRSQRGMRTPTLAASLFTTARMWKQPKCPWSK